MEDEDVVRVMNLCPVNTLLFNRAISSAGVLKSSAGVKRIYAKYNSLIPPIRKIYILNISFLPPINFLIALKFLYNLDPYEYILSIYIIYILFIYYTNYTE